MINVTTDESARDRWLLMCSQLMCCAPLDRHTFPSMVFDSCPFDPSSVIIVAPYSSLPSLRPLGIEVEVTRSRGDLLGK